jgi:pSer/pThr/pTyr-binding forkhead associated (FHA) protein
MDLVVEDEPRAPAARGERGRLPSPKPTVAASPRRGPTGPSHATLPPERIRKGAPLTTGPVRREAPPPPAPEQMENAPTRIEREEEVRSQIEGKPENTGPKLLIIGGNNRGREFVLKRGDNSIGRGVDNDIILADIAVSRKHTMVCFEAERYVMRDLGSGNGTLLNGKRVESHPLRDGDQLEMGNTLLRYVHPGEVVAALEAPASSKKTRGKPTSDSHRHPTEMAVPAKHPKTVRTPGLLNTRAKKLAVLGGVGLVLFFGLLVVAKVVVGKKPPPVAKEAQKSSDEVVAQEFQEAIEQFNARNWEKAREHLLKVQKLAPTVDGLKRYADQAEIEIAARDALEAAKKSLKDKDYQKARLALSKVPSTSLYVQDAKTQKQLCDDEELSSLLKEVESLKASGETEKATEQIKKAREIAPTNQKVKDLYAELVEGAGGSASAKKAGRTRTEPERPAAAGPSKGTKVAAAEKPRPSPAHKGGGGAKEPKGAAAKEPKGGGAKEPKAAPIAVSGGKSKTVIDLYKKKEWGAAAKAAREFAETQKGPKRKPADQLVSAIQIVGQNWLRAEKSAANPPLAIKYWKDTLDADAKIQKGIHQAAIKEAIFALAKKDATANFARGQYPAAFSSVKLAQKYGKDDAGTKKILDGLEKKAQELFNKAYTLRSSNLGTAKKIWQQVLKMVPTSSTAYQKSYQYINSAGPSFRDEDED